MTDTLDKVNDKFARLGFLNNAINLNVSHSFPLCIPGKSLLFTN
jgi:hypothetical protein